MKNEGRLPSKEAYNSFAFALGLGRLLSLLFRIEGGGWVAGGTGTKASPMLAPLANALRLPLNNTINNGHHVCLLMQALRLDQYFSFQVVNLVSAITRPGTMMVRNTEAALIQLVMILIGVQPEMG